MDICFKFLREAIKAPKIGFLINIKLFPVLIQLAVVQRPNSVC